jgi:hypothetical protein
MARGPIDPINEAKFLFRQSVLGKLKIRPGLPAPDSGDSVERERAFYKLILERALCAEERAEISSLWDIGCRNWSYVMALAEAFPRAQLTGVEVDGGRRYLNLHRRMDLARANAAAVEQSTGRVATTIFRNFLKVKASEGSTLSPMAFAFFFPFVSADPCRAWGLPKRFASFEKLLVHACLLSGEVPLILSTHQGNWEAEIAHETYLGMGFEVEERVLEPAEFQGLWPSPYPVHFMRTRSEAAT